MNVEINGEKVTLPFCSCGKCIIRRNREGNTTTKYPYNRNLITTYRNSFVKKDKGVSAPYFNRSLRNGFDGKYKEHLTSGLVSTMKFDFKPFLIKLDSSEKESSEFESIPFYGRSTYGSNFPSWGVASAGNQPKEKLPMIQVPFRGMSNYDDNYKNYDDHVITSPGVKQGSCLAFRGRVPNDSNTRESYQGRPNPFSMEKPKKYNIEKSYMQPADYPKEFGSTYGTSFRTGEPNYDCELAEHLKRRGMKNLEL